LEGGCHSWAAETLLSMQGQRTDHIIGAMDARSGLRSGCQAVATDTAQSIQPTHTRSEVCEDEFRCSRVLKKGGQKLTLNCPVSPMSPSACGLGRLTTHRTLMGPLGAAALPRPRGRGSGSIQSHLSTHNARMQFTTCTVPHPSIVLDVM